MFRFEIMGTPVTVHTNVLLVRWAGKHDVTLGSHIFLAPHASEVWPALLTHCVAHVRQWRDYGVLRFIGRYLLGLVSHGYAQHPFERNAMAFQRTFDAHPDILNAVRAMGGRV